MADRSEYKSMFGVKLIVLVEVDSTDDREYAKIGT